ncbi:MAG: glucuronosyltransferase, partial [Lentilitoribacter sp.]
FQIFIILVKERPNIVISTGAAPGFFALKLAKIMGAKTIWVDSIANAETLSLSGEKIAGSADIWLTQWEHIAKSYENGKRSPGYKGSVI